MTTYVCKPCNYHLEDDGFDIIDGKCYECGGPVETIPLLTTDRVSIKDTDPKYSPFGHVIMEDGTTYSLTKQWAHGVLLAILFPEIAKEKGYEPPDEEYNVYKYQKFELDNHDTLPVVRVAFSLTTDFYISKGKAPATKAQVESMVKIFKVLGARMDASIQTDAGEMTARAFLKELRSGGPSYDSPSPTTKLKTPKKGIRRIARRREDD